MAYFMATADPVAAADVAPPAVRARNPRWVFSSLGELQDSPSRRDGMSLEGEQHARLSALVVIRSMGKLLFQEAHNHVPIATAMVFFHRFYTRQSMVRHAPVVRHRAALGTATGPVWVLTLNTHERMA